MDSNKHLWPCEQADKLYFLNWFNNIEMPPEEDWIIMGDFNFIRSPSDRNKPGSDINQMLLFNEAISNLGLVELPLKGRKYSWSNMQENPLLEKLDWFFTSAAWMTSYLDSTALPMAKPIYDHLPCMIKIGTSIPKSKVFRFENYWLNHSSFKQVVHDAWNIPVGHPDCAKKINAKFKNVRRALKLWAKSLSCHKKQIAELNDIIFLWDLIEEYRALLVFVSNCRNILKEFLLTVLNNQKIYWKQRGKIKGVKFGDENTKFFHTKASINHRHNQIAMLVNKDQVEVTDHEGKAAILWDAFKSRLGQSNGHSMHFDLNDLYENIVDPHIFIDLEKPFTQEEIDDVVNNLPVDKSPGPDGFNNEFLKRCWDIIKEDVTELIMAFHAGNVNLESINSSFITLVPKKRCHFPQMTSGQFTCEMEY